MEPRYQNLGGQQQLVVESHADLSRIHELDPARWAATSAPVEDLHLDPRLLKLVVPEAGGRLRVSHLLGVRDWLFTRLRRKAAVDAGSETLLLEDLDDSSEAGRRLKEEAEAVLAALEVEDRTRLSLADLRRFRGGFDGTLANGDGVVVPSEIPDAVAADLAGWILYTVGGRADLKGARGIGHEEIQKFVHGAAAYRHWRSRPESEAGILPFGEGTAAAHALVDELAPKIEEWFLYCGLLEQEGPMVGAVRLTEEELRGLRRHGADAIRAYLAGSPLAVPRKDGRLPLAEAVNALYRDRFETLKRTVLAEVLGADAEALDREGWARVRGAFEHHACWRAGRPGQPFHEVPDEFLDDEKLEGLAGKLGEVVDQDLAASDRLAALEDLEKLILLQRWILVMARNLVSFQALYDVNHPALFQQGTLVIDGKRLELTVKVRDRAKHKKVASTSRIFLVYADILGADGKKVFEVAAPITAGERGRLAVGKRGILLGRDGKEWDAEVVDVVENPISVAEAVKAPFHRLANFVSDRVQALAASSLESAEESLAKAPVQAAAPAAGPAAPKTSFQNMAVMLSLATAALGSAAAFLLRAIAETNPLKFMGSLLGIVFLVGLTSGFLGWLRLRRRDMSPLLEANGWAVNVPLALTRELGALFTREPSLPGDPEKRSRWKWILLLVLVLASVLLWDEARLKVRKWLQRPKPPATAPAVPSAAPATATPAP